MSAIFTFLMLFNPSVHAHSNCPQTAQEWSNLRELSLKSVKSLDDLTVTVGRNLGSRLKWCAAEPDQKKFFTDPEFLSCMQAFKSTAEMAKLFEGTSDNFDSDAYLNPSRLINPELMVPPTEFTKINGGTESEMIQALISIRKKYPEMLAVEKVDGNFLILIPGEKFDRWINLASGSDSASFLYIGIQKKDLAGKYLSPQKSVFTSYRWSSTEQHQKIGHLSAPSSCLTCHRTGAMPILEHTDFTDHPLRAIFPGEKTEIIMKKMNDTVASTALAQPDSVSFEGLGGVGIGDNIERTDEFMKSCTTSSGLQLSSARIKAVRDSMNCVQCHDGLSQAGPLSFPLGLKDNLLKNIVRYGHMPPGSDDPNSKGFLDQGEREILYTCLMNEYYGSAEKITPDGLLIKHLLKVACPSSVIPKKAVSGAPIKNIKAVATPGTGPGPMSNPALMGR